MNTRTLLIASSVTMGLAGLAASFAPDELLVALDAPASAPLPVLVQLMGALYVAFAIANWTAKDSLIGGIYARPLALGNCLHFAVGAMALLKHVWATNSSALLLIAALVTYAIFALGFGYLVFGRGVACKVRTQDN